MWSLWWRWQPFDCPLLVSIGQIRRRGRLVTPHLQSTMLHPFDWMVYTAAIGKFRSSLCKYRFFGFLGGLVGFPDLSASISAFCNWQNGLSREWSKPTRLSDLGTVSRKSRWLLGPGKLNYDGRVCIQGQSFNNFENDEMKLSVNEANLTGLWAKL